MSQPELVLTADILWVVLNDLSERILRVFGCPIKLVVHGGIVMVLHPKLKCRAFTRDVDYIYRAFETKMVSRGIYDAGTKLEECIDSTGRKYGLGTRWMNADPDIALPMAQTRSGEVYDPLYTSAMSASNLSRNIIFSSPGLTLIAVSWPWAVALKLVRYQKDDPNDIAAILRLGRRENGTLWTRATLEAWLHLKCWPMSYHAYLPWQVDLARDRMRHAIQLARAYGW
ncbi:hypothetical protein GLOTRDRAFT_127257 [Gloeophyllum trabeum ATCC 11539]|uniref:Uncharacterized protein n=1 Tax=Gloeophyllum trabeum (strain ATCC 11539 / FP-39264 / Madison 617) TaxID=670483 RepID=S7QBY0_GLOTA|nr:uncharacterized protein GLOTRDRAFT_127257 [Gloeophyllum trabeum ATCC 11539]EPQ56863.1 hypothetical protein GLOTRDRAFT_127257 [Gloeophyllum trabeum ATCC 11539]